MTITYEWVAEEYDENNDIIDPMFGDTLAEVISFIEPAANVKYALVRNEGNDDDGITDRHYAYINDLCLGLPEYFDNSRLTIPMRYRKEFKGKRNQATLHIGD